MTTGAKSQRQLKRLNDGKPKTLRCAGRMAGMDDPSIIAGIRVAVGAGLWVAVSALLSNKPDEK
jgi:hypothetical protein